MQSGPIVIFDSGIGGFSVYQALKKKYPLERIFYVSDREYFPFGEKSWEVIEERVFKVVSWSERIRAKALILACHTASIYGKKALESAALPIHSMFLSGKKKIVTFQGNSLAILGSNLTVKSNVYQDLFLEKKGRVEGISMQPLIKAIEGKEDYSSCFSGHVKDRFSGVFLGCTHFSHVKAEIQAAFGEKTIVLDPIDDLIQEIEIEESFEANGGDRFFFTDQGFLFESLRSLNETSFFSMIHGQSLKRWSW